MSNLDKAKSEKAEIQYKGFEIVAWRDEALGGWENLYYFVMRQKDGWFLIDSFTEGDDKPADVVEMLKKQVDYYLEHPEAYEEDDYPAPGWMGDYGGPGCDPVDI
jgi:hypothetical protein